MNKCTRTCIFALVGSASGIGHTYFVPRDQMFQEPIWTALKVFERHNSEKQEFYGDVGISIGCQQTNGGCLGSYFFNTCGQLRIGPEGSNPDIRNTDLGLSSDAQGTIGIKPSISSFYTLFDAYLGFDEFVTGMWLSLRMPCIHQRWDTDIWSTVSNSGSDTYYTADGIIGALNLHDDTRYVVYDNAQAVPIAYRGAGALVQALGGERSFGDAGPLQAAKLTACRQTANGLAGIDVRLGYDFLQRQRVLASAGIGFIAPAANRPHNCCQTLFIGAPVIGSLHAWEFIGQLLGRVQLKHIENGASLDFYADAQVAALTHTKSTRTLGLRIGNNTCFNQYALLKKYAVSDTGASYVALEHAANILKADMRTRCNWQTQVTLILALENRGLYASLGYNFYARGRERCFSYKLCNHDWQLYKYTLVGNCPVLGYAAPNWLNGGFYDPNDTNVHTLGTLVPGSQQIAPAGPTPTLANISPVYAGAITQDMIDPTVALSPKIMSNTFFGAASYAWAESDWEPQLGVLVMYERGANTASPHTWSAFISGAISF